MPLTRGGLKPCALPQVSRIFAEHCKNAWDHDQGKHRMCFSDEHYMSTMLAWKGLEDQTDCKVPPVLASKPWQGRERREGRVQGLLMSGVCAASC